MSTTVNKDQYTTMDSIGLHPIGTTNPALTMSLATLATQQLMYSKLLLHAYTYTHEHTYCMLRLSLSTTDFYRELNLVNNISGTKSTLLLILPTLQLLYPILLYTTAHFLFGVSAKHLSDDVSTTVSQNATTGSATLMSVYVWGWEVVHFTSENDCVEWLCIQ